MMGQKMFVYVKSIPYNTFWRFVNGINPIFPLSKSTTNQSGLAVLLTTPCTFGSTYIEFQLEMSVKHPPCIIRTRSPTPMMSSWRRTASETKWKKQTSRWKFIRDKVYNSITYLNVLYYRFVDGAWFLR